MRKKYELTMDKIKLDGKVLSRIRALINFGSVNAGELGGRVEKEENLSQDGNAWVSYNAHICDNAHVGGSAYVSGNAYVGGNAFVDGNAWVGDEAYITKKADYLTVGEIESRVDTTIFYRTKDCVKVICGCFCGTLDAFIEAVKRTHGSTFYEKEYNAAIKLAKVHFGLEESGCKK